MEDILEKVEKLQEMSLLVAIGESPNSIKHDIVHAKQYPDVWVHLHIEAQTYLLAEILTELRKMNKLQILKKDIDFSYERSALLQYDRKESQDNE